jgi:hypothetical protein
MQGLRRNTEGKKPLLKLKFRRENNIKLGLKEIEYSLVN